MTHLSLQHFFDDSSMDFHTFSGWMVVVTNLLNAVAAAIILMFVVRLLCEGFLCAGKSHVSTPLCNDLPQAVASLIADTPLSAQVERAKKCLDFSATLYLIHLAIVSIIGGFPTSVTWCACAPPCQFAESICTRCDGFQNLACPAGGW